MGSHFDLDIGLQSHVWSVGGAFIVLPSRDQQAFGAIVFTIIPS